MQRAGNALSSWHHGFRSVRSQYNVSGMSGRIFPEMGNYGSSVRGTKLCACNARNFLDVSRLMCWHGACKILRKSRRAPGGFVKKIQRLSFLATLSIAIGMISWGSALQAQNTTPSTMPDRQAQQPSSSPDSTPAQQTPQTSPTPAPSTPETTPSSPAQSPSSQSPDANSPSSRTPDSSQTPNTTTPNSRMPQSGSQSASPSGSSSAAGSASSAAGAGESQTFSGTVTKQGDKYVLKDDAGHTYDIDHQDEVKKFEGKRVRVQGTLDPATNKIMVK